MIKADQIAPCR